MIGTHRFMHTLNIYGDAAAVIPYDPSQVGITWTQRHDAAPQSGEAVRR
jgi:hypothetical protein